MEKMRDSKDLRDGDEIRKARERNPNKKIFPRFIKGIRKMRA
jgi:hypothetical protein